MRDRFSPCVIVRVPVVEVRDRHGDRVVAVAVTGGFVEFMLPVGPPEERAQHEREADQSQWDGIREHHPRQPRPVRVLLPVDEVVRGRDLQRIAGDACPAMRRRAQANGLRPQLDRMIVAIARRMVEGGEDSNYYEWLGETIRSLEPRLIGMGILREGEIGVDNLTDRLREEALTARQPFVVGPMGAAFVRTPIGG